MSAATVGRAGRVPRGAASRHQPKQGHRQQARRQQRQHEHGQGRQASIIRTSGLTIVRLVICLGSIALAAVAIKESMRVRIFEAWLAGHILPTIGSIHAGAVPDAPIVWFAATSHRYLGLLVTNDCTVAFLMVPFLLCTAWNIWRQPGVARPPLALALALALLLGVNQVRIMTIAWLVRGLGISSGFYWGHTLVGSMITIFGVVLIFIFYILFLTAGRRGRARLSRRPAGTR